MPGSGIAVRGERIATLDWSEQGYSDDIIIQRIEEHLPKLFERLQCPEGKGECSINLAGNRLRGAEPIAKLLRKLREAKVQVITLRLHKNQLSDDAMDAVVEHIKKSTRDHRPLLELHLSDNRLTEVAVRRLVEAAHGCKYYFAANSTPERRCRALWLRCENQRPPLSDPHGLLDRLALDGLSVCLLPSKEFQPTSGKGRSAQMDAPVHMHHAFAPRAEHRMDKDGWGKEGKDNGKGGGKPPPVREWWDGKGPGKDGAPGGKGKGAAPPKGSGAENGCAKSKAFPNYEDHKGKGKAILESWRNLGNYRKRDDEQVEPEWKDWRSKDWEDGDLGESRRHPPTSDGPVRSQASSSRSASAWATTHRSEAGSSGAYPAQPSGPPYPHRQKASLPSYPIGHGQGAGQPSTGVQSNSMWESMSLMWLTGAVRCVQWRLKKVKDLGLLSKSTNPSSSEEEWLKLAKLGSQCIAQHCTQRASVVAGSFVEEGAVYELGSTCAAEYNLAVCFRHLQMASFFPPETIKDEQNDAQCASLLCSLYGEILDAPEAGESNHKVNARKAAEWALLDYVFLTGTSRLISAGLVGMGTG